MNLQQLFDEVVMSGETVSLELPSRQAYESLRVALVRKYTRYRALCQEAGIESYDERFIACALRADQEKTEQFVATFRLAWKEESKRTPRDYQVLKL
jgi:hypothetical protein